MTNPLEPADLYHTGIVVPDLDAAMARYTAVGGYRWTTPLTNKLPVRIGWDTREVEVTLVYSLQSPHLELITQVPGTPWTPAPGNAVHHLGYFTDRLVDTGQALEANGFRLELCADLPGSTPALFAYYVDDAGTLIEIVDRTVFGDWESFLQALTA